MSDFKRYHLGPTIAPHPYGALATVGEHFARTHETEEFQARIPPDRILHVHGGAGNALCGNIDDDQEADDLYFDRPLPGHVPCARCVNVARNDALEATLEAGHR